MKNKQQGFIIPLIIAIIALLAIGGGVYAYHEKKGNDQMMASTSAEVNLETNASSSGTVSNTAPASFVSVNTNVGVTTSLPTTNISWKTYTDSTYGYSISYPSTWIVEDNNVSANIGRNFCDNKNGCDAVSNNLTHSPRTNAPILLLANPLNFTSQNSAYTNFGDDTSGKFMLTLYLANPIDKAIYDQMVKSFKVSHTATVIATTSSLTLVSPNGGEILKAGQTYIIKWKSSEKTGTVNIDLLAGGHDRGIINYGKNTPISDGEYTWTVPAPYATEGNETNDVIVISSVRGSTDTMGANGNITIQDRSDGSFTITQ